MASRLLYFIKDDPRTTSATHATSTTHASSAAHATSATHATHEPLPQRSQPPHEPLPRTLSAS